MSDNKIDVFAMIDEYMKKKDHEEAVKMIDEYIEETARENEMARIMAERFMTITYIPMRKPKKQKRKELAVDLMFRMFYLAIGLIIIAGVINIIK